MAADGRPGKGGRGQHGGLPVQKWCEVQRSFGA